MSTVVICGNGGDWEYLTEEQLWEVWIKKNIGTDKFSIIPHREGDKAIIQFNNPEDELLFRIKAPMDGSNRYDVLGK